MRNCKYDRHTALPGKWTSNGFVHTPIQQTKQSSVDILDWAFSITMLVLATIIVIHI